MQFGGQEPESDEKIAEFCELNHGVTFPLMAKSDVNGDNTNEVYKWLKSQKAGILGLTRIKVSSHLLSPFPSASSSPLASCTVVQSHCLLSRIYFVVTD